MTPLAALADGVLAGGVAYCGLAAWTSVRNAARYRRQLVRRGRSPLLAVIAGGICVALCLVAACALTAAIVWNHAAAPEATASAWSGLTWGSPGDHPGLTWGSPGITGDHRGSPWVGSTGAHAAQAAQREWTARA
jgi:hypothetical protein